MRDTLFATFATAYDAELALGALLDHGVNRQDLSVILNDPRQAHLQTVPKIEAEIPPQFESEPSQPSNSTVPLGHGISILAGLFPPPATGTGILLGRGAISQALVEMTGTAAVNHPALDSLLFLVEQGVPKERVMAYAEIIKCGGALVSISVPSGDLTEYEVRSVLTKHASQPPETFHVICDMNHERHDQAQRNARLQKFASL